MQRKALPKVGPLILRKLVALFRHNHNITFVPAYYTEIPIAPGEQPTATILFAGPTLIRSGDPVLLVGSGQDPEGPVAATKWVSNIDGIFATGFITSSTALSPGNHTISFSVKDAGGQWSAQSQVAVTVQDSTIIDSLLLSLGCGRISVVADSGHSGFSLGASRLTLIPTDSFQGSSFGCTRLTLIAQT